MVPSKDCYIKGESVIELCCTICHRWFYFGIGFAFKQIQVSFLSGVITLLPIMTLINISLQMKNMNLTEFRMTQKNAIVGAFGAVILMSSIFLLSNWVKPLYAVIGASVIYVGYMVGYMCFISQKLSV